jgi:hypothetical protein
VANVNNDAVVNVTINSSNDGFAILWLKQVIMQTQVL